MHKSNRGNHGPPEDLRPLWTCTPVSYHARLPLAARGPTARRRPEAGKLCKGMDGRWWLVEGLLRRGMLYS